MTVKNPPATRSNLFRNLTRFREFGIIIFILILAVIVSLRAPVFFTLGNFRDILLDISILVIVALAQTMVILTHGIDLSVGSVIGLVAMMVAFTIKANPGISLVLVVVLGMALGAVLGSFQRPDHCDWKSTSHHRHLGHIEHLSWHGLLIQPGLLDPPLPIAGCL